MRRGTINIPVVSVVLRRNGNVLFVLRKNTTWMNGFYGLPGGHVENNESFKQAACREALEEVGIELKPEQLEPIMISHQQDDEKDVRVSIYFEASDWTGEPYNAEPEAHSEIAWLDLNNLPDNVIPTSRQKFIDMKAGKNYGEYGWDKHKVI